MGVMVRVIVCDGVDGEWLVVIGLVVREVVFGVDSEWLTVVVLVFVMVFSDRIDGERSSK